MRQMQDRLSAQRPTPTKMPHLCKNMQKAVQDTTNQLLAIISISRAFAVQYHSCLWGFSCILKLCVLQVMFDMLMVHEGDFLANASISVHQVPGFVLFV